MNIKNRIYIYNHIKLIFWRFNLNLIFLGLFTLSLWVMSDKSMSDLPKKLKDDSSNSVITKIKKKLLELSAELLISYFLL